MADNVPRLRTVYDFKKDSYKYLPIPKVKDTRQRFSSFSYPDAEVVGPGGDWSAGQRSMLATTTSREQTKTDYFGKLARFEYLCYLITVSGLGLYFVWKLYAVEESLTNEQQNEIYRQSDSQEWHIQYIGHHFSLKFTSAISYVFLSIVTQRITKLNVYRFHFLSIFSLVNLLHIFGYRFVCILVIYPLVLFQLSTFYPDVRKWVWAVSSSMYLINFSAYIRTAIKMIVGGYISDLKEIISIHVLTSVILNTAFYCLEIQDFRENNESESDSSSESSSDTSSDSCLGRGSAYKKRYGKANVPAAALNCGDSANKDRSERMSVLTAPLPRDGSTNKNSLVKATVLAAPLPSVDSSNKNSSEKPVLLPTQLPRDGSTNKNHSERPVLFQTQLTRDGSINKNRSERETILASTPNSTISGTNASESVPNTDIDMAVSPVQLANDKKKRCKRVHHSDNSSTTSYESSSSNSSSSYWEYESLYPDIHSRTNMLIYLFYMPKLVFSPYISNAEFSKFVIDGGPKKYYFTNDLFDGMYTLTSNLVWFILMLIVSETMAHVRPLLNYPTLVRQYDVPLTVGLMLFNFHYVMSIYSCFYYLCRCSSLIDGVYIQQSVPLSFTVYNMKSFIKRFDSGLYEVLTTETGLLEFKISNARKGISVLNVVRGVFYGCYFMGVGWWRMAACVLMTIGAFAEHIYRTHFHTIQLCRFSLFFSYSFRWRFYVICFIPVFLLFSVWPMTLILMPELRWIVFNNLFGDLPSTAFTIIICYVNLQVSLPGNKDHQYVNTVIIDMFTYMIPVEYFTKLLESIKLRL